MTELLHHQQETFQINRSLKGRTFTLAGAPRYKDSKEERKQIHSRLLVYVINILFWSSMLLILSLMFDQGI